jgi:hypothetical protein
MWKVFDSGVSRVKSGTYMGKGKAIALGTASHLKDDGLAMF